MCLGYGKSQPSIHLVPVPFENCYHATVNARRTNTRTTESNEHLFFAMKIYINHTDTQHNGCHTLTLFRRSDLFFSPSPLGSRSFVTVNEKEKNSTKTFQSRKQNDKPIEWRPKWRKRKKKYWKTVSTHFGIGYGDIVQQMLCENDILNIK